MKSESVSTVANWQSCKTGGGGDVRFFNSMRAIYRLVFYSKVKDPLGTCVPALEERVTCYPCALDSLFVLL